MTDTVKTQPQNADAKTVLPQRITFNKAKKNLDVAALPFGMQLIARAADGGEFIKGLEPVEINPARDLVRDGAGYVLTKRLEFSPHGTPATVSDVWLIGDGFARVCAVSGNLRIGNGNEAAIPGGFLIFRDPAPVAADAA